MKSEEVIGEIFLRKFLVGPSGLEPPTSCLSGTRSNLLSYEPMWLVSDFVSLEFGGDDGIRTHEPLLAGQVLSQLSYTPEFFGWAFSHLFVGSGKRDFTLSSLLLCQHRTIFPCGRPQSIVATAELNFCVRNGNRWTLCVWDTDYFSFKNPWSLKIEQHNLPINLSSISHINYVMPNLFRITRSP